MGTGGVIRADGARVTMAGATIAAITAVMIGANTAAVTTTEWWGQAQGFLGPV